MGLKLAQKKFLLAFIECGRVSEAAALARVGKRNHWDWLDDPEYKAAFDRARNKAADLFEDELVKRAVSGDEENVVYQGKICKDEVSDQPLKIKRKSDVLLMFLLKSLRPEKYRDNAKVEMTGSGGGPLSIKVVYDDADDQQA